VECLLAIILFSDPGNRIQGLWAKDMYARDALPLFIDIPQDNRACKFFNGLGLLSPLRPLRPLRHFF
jgi:hypothetical protein